MKNIMWIFLFFVTLPVFADSYNLGKNGHVRPDMFEEPEERILFILDFSNSMSEHLHGVPKVDLMMETMRNILPKINKNASIGMRVYGHRMGITPFEACKASALITPIAPANSINIQNSLTKIRPRGMTPITYSLKQAVKYDFLGFPGKKHIILLSDGGENCDESPCKYAMELIKTRSDITIDVIAFNLNNQEDLEQLECAALVTKGKFHTANTAAELANSLNNTLNIKKDVEAKIIFNP